MNYVEKINQELRKQLLSPRIFLGKCQTLDKSSKESIAFQDNTHLPFYYYLGKYLPRNNIINIGFGIGFPLVCYLSARPMVLDLCVQQDNNIFYHPRLGLANLRTVTKLVPKVFVGKFEDKDFHDYLEQRKWNAAIISAQDYDKTLQICETIWGYLDDDGYICLEGIGAKSIDKVFNTFCTLVNREGHRVKSRFGNGLVFKNSNYLHGT